MSDEWQWAFDEMERVDDREAGRSWLTIPAPIWNEDVPAMLRAIADLWEREAD